MSRARRWIAGIAVFGGLVIAPVALAVDAFGPAEPADPELWVGALLPDSPQLAADGSGNAIFGSVSADRMAVYERCGGSPATWRRELIGSADSTLLPLGVAMNAAGAALAVWQVANDDGTTTTFSSARPAGGAWGPQQEIVTGHLGAAAEFALGGNGDAVAAWNQSDPAATRVAIRPAGGDWDGGTTLAAAAQAVRTAMSPAGDAVVLSFAAPAKEVAYFRPAGGPWGSSETLVDLPYNISPGLNQFVEFDGDGRAVAVYGQQGVLRASARSGGAWSQTPAILDQATGVGITRLARLPHGVVALWGRGGNAGEIAVARLGPQWEAKHTYTAARFARVSAGADGAGRVLLAATVMSGPSFHDEEIQGATVAPGADWPAALGRLSPPGDAGPLYRDPLAAGGGNALFLAWGVHATAAEHSEVIATGPAPLACDAAASPTPVPTASASPSPSPQPQPQPHPKLPKAIGGFVALPKASRCVNRLTLKVRHPKGFTVKQVVVRLNGRRAKLIKGRALRKSVTLRHLPPGGFTVSVAVKLSGGRTLQGTRRYKRCA